MHCNRHKTSEKYIWLNTASLTPCNFVLLKLRHYLQNLYCVLSWKVTLHHGQCSSLRSLGNNESYKTKGQKREMCGIIKVKSKLSKRESFKTGSWQSGDRKRWREEKKSAGFTLFLHSGRASKNKKKRKNVSSKRLSPKSVIPTYI